MDEGRTRFDLGSKMDVQSLEDLVGGRVLAWIGGLAIGIGVILLLAVAISQGWLGPAARVGLAGTGGIVLLAAGIWLHERRGRTDAARAASAGAICSLFATVTVAARVYELVPAALGLALVLLTGAVAVSLALRWDSRGIAGLGLLGGLLSPVLAGAHPGGATMALLFAASLCAAAVVIRRSWDWYALGIFGVVTPQWIAWLPSAGEWQVIAALASFGGLGVAVAVGFDLLQGERRLRPASEFLLVLNAIVIAVAGALTLHELGHPLAAKLWLVALALLHTGAGLACRRIARAGDHLALIALTLGVLLADVAFGLLATRPVLAVTWAGAGAAFAWLSRRGRGHDTRFALAGMGGHLALAIVEGLLQSLPAAIADTGLVMPLTSLGTLAAACFVSARVIDPARSRAREALDATGLAAVAYLSATAFDGVQLVCAWAFEALALAQVARRTRERTALAGAVCFLGGATSAALALVGPRVLVYGLDQPAEQALAVAVVAAVALRFAQLRLGGGRWPALAAAFGGSSILYLASAALVTPFQPGAGEQAGTLLDVGIRQEGQVLMSGLWALAGVAAVVVGLRRDNQAVRVAALSLVLAAVGKVFLFDLATLSSLYRVASFIALGLLLLGGAFAWQRTRPRPAALNGT